MKYYLLAGEASGDMHGANLAKALVKKDQHARFQFWGGDQMAEVIGCPPVKHISELAFMGFIEVVANLGTILSNFKLCEKDIAEFDPDVLILIDYPGFNLRMAKFAHNRGIKVVYYISPQVWAWKESRVKKIKKYVDLMLCILPFEQDFYQKWNYEVSYVGHPLLDVVNRYEKEQKSDDQTLAPIALIPGSRKQEIKKMLPVMLNVARAMPKENFEVAAAPAIDASFYNSFELPNNVSLIVGATPQVMYRAKAALVTSGTATLETALFETPEVVCYKGSFVSYWLAKQLIKVKYISLVNLIMDKEVVKELIQAEFNTKRCVKELKKFDEIEKRTALLDDYQTLKEMLGGAGAAERAAHKILTFIG